MSAGLYRLSQAARTFPSVPFPLACPGELPWACPFLNLSTEHSLRDQVHHVRVGRADTLPTNISQPPQRLRLAHAHVMLYCAIGCRKRSHVKRCRTSSRCRYFARTVANLLHPAPAFGPRPQPKGDGHEVFPLPLLSSNGNAHCCSKGLSSSTLSTTFVLSSCSSPHPAAPWRSGCNAFAAHNEAHSQSNAHGTECTAFGTTRHNLTPRFTPDRPRLSVCATCCYPGSSKGGHALPFTLIPCCHVHTLPWSSQRTSPICLPAGRHNNPHRTAPLRLRLSCHNVALGVASLTPVTSRPHCTPTCASPSSAPPDTPCSSTTPPGSGRILTASGPPRWAPPRCGTVS